MLNWQCSVWFRRQRAFWCTDQDNSCCQTLCCCCAVRIYLLFLNIIWNQFLVWELSVGRYGTKKKRLHVSSSCIFFGCKTVFIRRRLRFNTFRNRFVYYQRHSNHSCKYFAFESLVTIYTLISWLHDWFHIRWERRFWHVFALLHYYTVLNTFFGIMNVVSIYSRNTWKAVI